MTINSNNDIGISQPHLYPKITLADNPNITQEEYQRALSISAEICDMLKLQAELSEAGGLKAGLDKTSDVWKSSTGLKAYGEVVKKDPLSPDYEMVNHLLIHAFHFSGYHLANIISDQQIPSWTNSIAGLIPQQYSRGAPDWSIGAFLEMCDQLPGEFICRPLVKLGWVGWQADGTIINRDLMAYQERVALLYQSGVLEQLLHKQGPLNILEIGGGYGGLAYFLKKILPNSNYYICDLPESLFYSATYLALTTGSNEICLYKRDGEAINECIKNPKGGFVFIPHFLFDDLHDLKIDLAINTLSFAEMEPVTVTKYAENISSMLNDGSYLFEQNYDNSYFSHKVSNFCNPEEVISSTTNLKKKLVGVGRWGPARLWSPEDKFPESQTNFVNYQAQPVLVQKGYKGFNIIQYWNKYMGIPIELGALNISALSQSALNKYLNENIFIIGKSIEDVATQIDSRTTLSADIGSESRIVPFMDIEKEDYKGYYIVPMEQNFVATDKSLVGKFPLEPKQFEEYLATGKLMVAKSVEALQDKIDYFTFKATPQQMEANYKGYQIFFFQFDYYALLINRVPIRKLSKPLSRPLFLSGSTINELKGLIDQTA